MIRFCTLLDICTITFHIERFEIEYAVHAMNVINQANTRTQTVKMCHIMATDMDRDRRRDTWWENGKSTVEKTCTECVYMLNG